MNNSGVPLGPAPAPGPERRHRLSEPQAAALDALRGGPQPQRATQLAAALRLHPNTTREHLDALVAAGLVVRTPAAVTGRGRPAWLYAAVEDPEPDVRLRDYAGLAMALAAHVQAAPDPAGAAVAIGRGWGQELAGADTGSAPPRQRVLDLLAELGFAPAGPVRGPVALRRCPLLEAARRYPDVVCRVHLGMVRGALEAFGGAATSDLIPFAEPGFCRLEFDVENVTPIAPARVPQ